MTATVPDTPLRPDTNKITPLAGNHVVVTQAWYEANEEQRSHLLACALDQCQRIADLERLLTHRDELIAQLRARTT